MNIKSTLSAFNALQPWKKIALFILITIIFSLITKRLNNSNKPVIHQVKVVETEEVKQQDIKQTVLLMGTIHPKHLSVLMAKGSGMLDAVVPTGEKISKGTLIAKIDNPELEKNLRLFQATEKLAKSQYERIRPLLKTGYISAKDIEEKKQLWINAQKELAKTKIELDNLRFYAPFDGIIGAYKKREGAQVNQGEAVVTMYDPSALVVDFDIPCTHLTDIKEGQEIHILKKKYALNHVQRMIDEDTHMCPADVEIVCNDCLIGTSIVVELVVREKHQTIVIPYQALFLRNSRPFVYIANEGKVKLVSVKTGIKQRDKIEITSGLEPGQQLITKGQERLYPTLAIEIFHPPIPQTPTIT